MRPRCVTTKISTFTYVCLVGLLLLTVFYEKFAFAASPTAATTTPMTSSVVPAPTSTIPIIVASFTGQNQNLPEIVSVMATSSATNASVFWTTNQVSNSQVMYGTSTAYTATSTGTNLALNHSVLLSSLIPNTTYHFEVSSSNGIGTSVSPDETFTTSTNLSTSTPTDSLGIIVVPTTSAAAVTWVTDQPTNSEVLYGLTPNYTASTTGEAAVIGMTTSHEVTITGLAADTTYHFAIISTDALGTPVVISTDQQFTTMTSPTGS